MRDTLCSVALCLLFGWWFLCAVSAADPERPAEAVQPLVPLQQPLQQPPAEQPPAEEQHPDECSSLRYGIVYDMLRHHDRKLLANIEVAMYDGIITNAEYDGLAKLNEQLKVKAWKTDIREQIRQLRLRFPGG